MSGDAAVERVSGTGGRAARLAGQVATVFRIELGRNLRSPGAIGLALFALLPAAPPAALWMGHALGFTEAHLPEVTTAYAALFQSLVLRVVLFFGCVLVFTNLVRRELRHRTLHHWLLAPLRREVLLGLTVYSMVTLPKHLLMHIQISMRVVHLDYGETCSIF
jgi:hypothetical protein